MAERVPASSRDRRLAQSLLRPREKPASRGAKARRPIACRGPSRADGPGSERQRCPEHNEAGQQGGGSAKCVFGKVQHLRISASSLLAADLSTSRCSRTSRAGPIGINDVTWKNRRVRSLLPCGDVDSGIVKCRSCQPHAGRRRARTTARGPRVRPRSARHGGANQALQLR